MCDKFGDLFDDEELLGDQMVIIEKKYVVVENFKFVICSLMMWVVIKYNNWSGCYCKFGIVKMGDMIDVQLIFCGWCVVCVVW